MKELSYLLSFDIVGTMAHFRKFYTNSSSLTYHIPPRTTIAGIIAAILGVERDSYYEDFSTENLKIGVSIESQSRKIVQIVNYLFTKANTIYDKGRGTQVPVEFIVPKSFDKTIRYRVYISSPKKDFPFDPYSLYERIKKRQCRWPVYLGISECIASVENPYFTESPDYYLDPNESFSIKTAIPTYRIISDLNLNPGLRVFNDRVILDFNKYPYRSPKRVENILWEANGNPIKLKVSGLVFKIPNTDTYGVFLE